jgi:hypothetical protein
VAIREHLGRFEAEPLRRELVESRNAVRTYVSAGDLAFKLLSQYFATGERGCKSNLKQRSFNLACDSNNKAFAVFLCLDATKIQDLPTRSKRPRTLVNDGVKGISSHIQTYRLACLL